MCVHGNAYVRNCHFEASRLADLEINAEHGSSVRRCTSVAFQDVPGVPQLGGPGDAPGLSCRSLDRCGRGDQVWRRAGDVVRLRLHPSVRQDPARQTLRRPVDCLGNVCAGGGAGVSCSGARVYEVPLGQRTGAVASAVSCRNRLSWPKRPPPARPQRHFVDPCPPAGEHLTTTSAHIARGNQPAAGEFDGRGLAGRMGEGAIEQHRRLAAELDRPVRIGPSFDMTILDRHRGHRVGAHQERLVLRPKCSGGPRSRAWR